MRGVRILVLFLSCVVGLPAAHSQELVQTILLPEARELVTFLYGTNRSFAATAQLATTFRQQQETVEATIVCDRGLLRAETSLDRCRFGQAAPDELTLFRQAGLDQAVAILRTDQKLAYVIFPRMKAYCTLATDQKHQAKIERKEAGPAELDGQPCKLVQLTITDADGQASTATSWEAEKLAGLPIQFELKRKDSTVTLHLKNIQVAKPDAWLFEPPVGYRQATGFNQLLMDAVRKVAPFLGE